MKNINGIFDRINVSKRIDVNKTGELNECNICQYWYYLNKGFKFQQIVCNECYDLVMMSMNLSDITILNIKGSDYCCIISGISKDGAMNFMQNVYLNEKSGTL